MTLFIWINMPVSFLSSAQCDNYAKYPTDLPSDIVDSLFFPDNHDLEWIASKRGDFSRLGYALQLTTVRFIGSFIADLSTIPQVVIEPVATQIKISDPESCLSMYQLVVGLINPVNLSIACCTYRF